MRPNMNMIQHFCHVCRVTVFLRPSTSTLAVARLLISFILSEFNLNNLSIQVPCFCQRLCETSFANSFTAEPFVFHVCVLVFDAVSVCFDSAPSDHLCYTCLLLFWCLPVFWPDFWVAIKGSLLNLPAFTSWLSFVFWQLLLPSCSKLFCDNECSLVFYRYVHIFDPFSPHFIHSLSCYFILKHQ